MSQFQFFESQQQNIPEVLSFRNDTYTMTLFGILTLSFFLISLSRASNSHAIPTVLTVFFRGESAEQELKENMRLGSFSSVLLIGNYFIGFSICTFLMLVRFFHFHYIVGVVLSLVLPVALFLLSTLGLLISGWISGEQKRIFLAMLHTLTGVQFTGLLLSALSLFWIMNPGMNEIFVLIFLSIVSLQIITRLIKNSYTVFIEGVPWYYIILYFCTLEILPLFVTYYYVLKNFRI